MSIVFKRINDEYSWAYYGKFFKVIIMNENRFVNISYLIRLGNEIKNRNKRKTAKKGRPIRLTKYKAKDWKKKKGTKDLVAGLAKYLGCRKSKLMMKVENTSDADKQLRGTYVHELLVPDVSRWISVEFAIKMYRIMTKYCKEKAKKKLNAELTKKDKVIEAKDDKISELEEILRKIQKDTNEIKAGNKRIERNTEILKTDNTELKEQNKATHRKLDRTKNVVRKAGKNYSPKPSKGNEEYIVAVELGNEEGAKYNHKFLAVKKKCITTREKQIKKQHSGSKILKQIPDINSKNLLNRLTEDLVARDKIYTNYSSIRFRRPYTLEDFLKDIKATQQEVYEFLENEIDIASKSDDEEDESPEEENDEECDDTDTTDESDEEPEPPKKVVKKTTKTKSTPKKGPVKKIVAKKEESEESESDNSEEEMPAPKKKAATKPKIEESENDSEEDVPVPKKKVAQKKKAPVKKKFTVDTDSDEDSEEETDSEPAPKKKRTTKK